MMKTIVVLIETLGKLLGTYRMVNTCQLLLPSPTNTSLLDAWKTKGNTFFFFFKLQF